MPQQFANSPRKLPGWVVPVGSVLILLHFLAVGTLVLAASSGFWPVRMGDRLEESMASGPKFAEVAGDIFVPFYLEPLRLTQNLHYTPERIPKLNAWDLGNRFQVSAVTFEARLKNAQGAVIKTLKFPGEGGSPWLRHRYKLLALGLGNDQPVPVNLSEVIQAPGEKMRKVTIWDAEDPKLWKLKTVDEHLVPKDRPVMQPSEWTLMLARSYQRYLLRAHENADSVELIRHWKNPVLPDWMYAPPPPSAFEELLGTFGDYRREK